MLQNMLNEYCRIEAEAGYTLTGLFLTNQSAIASISSVFSSSVPTVIRRQLSHKVTLLLSLTTMPLNNKYWYSVFASSTFTSKKLASEGYTLRTKGSFSK